MPDFIKFFIFEILYLVEAPFISEKSASGYSLNTLQKVSLSIPKVSNSAIPSEFVIFPDFISLAGKNLVTPELKNVMYYQILLIGSIWFRLYLLLCRLMLPQHFQLKMLLQDLRLQILKGEIGF